MSKTVEELELELQTLRNALEGLTLRVRQQSQFCPDHLTAYQLWVIADEASKFLGEEASLETPSQETDNSDDEEVKALDALDAEIQAAQNRAEAALRREVEDLFSCSECLAKKQL